MKVFKVVNAETTAKNDKNSEDECLTKEDHIQLLSFEKELSSQKVSLPGLKTFYCFLLSFDM